MAKQLLNPQLTGQTHSTTILSELLNRPIYDPHGGRIASVADVVVRISDGNNVTGAEQYPPVIGVVSRGAGLGQRRFFIPWAQITRMDTRGVFLSTAAINIAPFVRRDCELLLAKDLLDKQVVDVDGHRVIRVNDLQLSWIDTTYLLIGVDVSYTALARRLGVLGLVETVGARLGKRVQPSADQTIDWAQVEHFASDVPAIRLTVSHKKIAALRPTEIAQLVEELAHNQGVELLASLDADIAADTVEELDTQHQTELLSALPPEDAADIIDEMAPDEAADVLASLAPKDATALLKQLERPDAEEIKALLGYPEDSAGGIMTTHYITIQPDWTVQQALEQVRATGHQADFLAYLFVVDSLENNALVGVLSLARLVLAAPTDLVANLMTTDLVTVSPLESQEEAAALISRYNLLALPVVKAMEDEDEQEGVASAQEPDSPPPLLGIITVDDAMDIILPTAWKKRLPKIFSKLR